MSAVRLQAVPVSALFANERNVREFLEGVEDLAASIRANGVLQPLIVNNHGGRLVVTDGHRRLAACRLAGVPQVMCLVTTGASSRQVTTTMLAAAMHKQLTPMEQARAFAVLRREGVSTADIARTTGYSIALVRARLLLLELPSDAQDMVEDNNLTIAQATDLAKQVRASRSGSTSVRTTKRSTWLSKTHRVAKWIDCEHASTRTLIGGVGCGQCWEEAIRADERGDLAVGPAYDFAVVERVLSGERLPLSRDDRLECVRRLVADKLSDGEIAARINSSGRQVLRDRQKLNLAAPIQSGSGLPRAVVA